MKKTIFTIIVLLVIKSLSAQERIHQKELGFVFSDLDNFGLSFKIGNNVSKWRINTLMINGGENSDEQVDNKYESSILGAKIKLGRENYIRITENIMFCLGIDLAFGYTAGTVKRTSFVNPDLNYDRKFTTVTKGANFVLGFNYLINKKFVIGIEILPEYSAFTRDETETDVNGIETKTVDKGYNYGFSNSTAQLSIAVRF